MSPTTAKILNTKAGKWTLNKLIDAAKGAEKGKEAIKTAAWKMELNPKEAIKSGTAFAAENPLTVAGQVGGTPATIALVSALPASTPLALKAGLMGSPVGPGTILGAAEQIGKRHIPAYANVTKAAGKWVRTSPTFDAALGNYPAATFQNSGPTATFRSKLAYNGRSALAGLSNTIQGAGRTIATAIQ